MPSGKVHAAQSYKLAFVLSVAGVGASVLVNPVLVGLALGGWIGVLVTPDIDHHYITHEEHRISRWNRLAGFLWHLYWWPYEKLRPHRGRSHTWPAGTVERMVYLCWPALLVSAFHLGGPDGFGVWVVLFWILVFIGWSAQDCLHISMDGR